MNPLFCTHAVPFEVIGEKMQTHVEKYNMDKRSRRLLVGGMKQENLAAHVFTEMVFEPWFASD